MDVTELIALLGELPPDTPVHTCSVLIERTPGWWTVEAIGTDEHFAQDRTPQLKPSRSHTRRQQ
jgi:hypothetical protein